MKIIENKSALKDAQTSIENLTVNPQDYPYTFASGLKIVNKNPDECKNHTVLFKDESKLELRVNYSDKAKNSVILIGQNVTGKLNINVRCDNALIHIGNNCFFSSLFVSVREKNSSVLVGESVRVTGSNKWHCSRFSGLTEPSIIIGDDCLFASNVIVRTSDAHLIFDMRTKKQKNTASKNIHLEPHIWVCEDVKILKGIYIGACSIIGAAALVTRDVPRFSRCYGSPAKSVVDETTFWSINDNKKSIKRAIHYTKKYQKLELSHPWSS